MCVKIRVGATSPTARDAKIKYLHAKHLLDGDKNALLRKMFLEEHKNNTKWTKQLKHYKKEANIPIGDLQRLNKDKIIEKVKKWDLVL